MKQQEAYAFATGTGTNAFSNTTLRWDTPTFANALAKEETHQ